MTVVTSGSRRFDGSFTFVRGTRLRVEARKFFGIVTFVGGRLVRDSYKMLWEIPLGARVTVLPQPKKVGDNPHYRAQKARETLDSILGTYCARPPKLKWGDLFKD